MSDMYCVYNGKKYKIKKKNDKYIITSRVRKEGFINYIDVLGNEHSELFMKIVNANEVDICLLYTSPSPRDRQKSRMPSSA